MNQNIAVATGQQATTNRKALRFIGACSDAINWVSQQPDQTPQVLWDTCDMYPWMCFLLTDTKNQRTNTQRLGSEAKLLSLLILHSEYKEEIDPILVSCITDVADAPPPTDGHRQNQLP